MTEFLCITIKKMLLLFMVFRLASLLSILHVILTNLRSLPKSAFVITLQFVTIPLWLLNLKSVWFLVSPIG